jgi:hypothetical protein
MSGPQDRDGSQLKTKISPDLLCNITQSRSQDKKRFCMELIRNRQRELYMQSVQRERSC